MSSSSQAMVPLKQNIQKSRFIEKPIFKYIYNVEKAFKNLDPYGYAMKIFFDKFNHLPYDYFKTNDFYEKNPE